MKKDFIQSFFFLSKTQKRLLNEPENCMSFSIRNFVFEQGLAPKFRGAFWQVQQLILSSILLLKLKNIFKKIICC